MQRERKTTPPAVAVRAGRASIRPEILARHVAERARRWAPAGVDVVDPYPDPELDPVSVAGFTPEEWASLRGVALGAVVAGVILLAIRVVFHG